MSDELTLDQRAKLVRDRGATTIAELQQYLGLLDEALHLLRSPLITLSAEQKQNLLAQYQDRLGSVRAAGLRLPADPINFMLDDEDNLAQFDESKEPTP